VAAANSARFAINALPASILGLGYGRKRADTHISPPSPPPRAVFATAQRRKRESRRWRSGGRRPILPLEAVIPMWY